MSLRPEDLYGGGALYNYDWNKPKAVLNKSTRSRGQWRISAFPDTEGVAFYQTYIGVWPTTDDHDELLLAAILNSPIANAFVATREGKTDKQVEIGEQQAKLKETIISLSRLCGKPRKIMRFRGLLFTGMNLTDAIRTVLRNSPESLRPIEIRDRLVSGGFNVKAHSNIMASIHTALKRLTDTGKVLSGEREGKATYAWNHRRASSQKEVMP